MARAAYNRVKFTSTTTGTGTITAGGAVSGFKPLSTFTDGDSGSFLIVDASGAWEIFRDGVVGSSGTTLTRGTFEASSTGSALTLSAGTHTVSNIFPASYGLRDWLSPLQQAEIAITTTATLTLDRMHVCSGTSANYTVTLPASSGNAGRFIGVRMAPGMTKLITLDGNASETIDGALTREMWASESAILMCDGSNWFKIAGRPIPMTVRLTRATDSSVISSSVWTAVAMTAKELGADLMWDSGNGRATVPRAGSYQAAAFAYVDPVSGSLAGSYVGVGINGSSPVTAIQASYSGGSAAAAAFSGKQFACVAGDYLQGFVYMLGTGTCKVLGAGGASIDVVEISPW